MPKSKSELPALTRAEEAVMKALWQFNKALVRELIGVMPAPKPHANTVNTLLKILAEKGYVASEPMGNANRYYALVSKDAYSSRSIAQVVKGYFNGSFTDMVSFFVADKGLDITELEQALKSLKNKKQ